MLRVGDEKINYPGGCLDRVRSGPSLAPPLTEESVGRSRLGTSLFQDLTALVWITKRTKNAASNKEKLEVCLEGKSLLISLEREISRTGVPEEGQQV